MTNWIRVMLAEVDSEQQPAKKDFQAIHEEIADLIAERLPGFTLASTEFESRRSGVFVTREDEDRYCAINLTFPLDSRPQIQIKVGQNQKVNRKPLRTNLRALFSPTREPDILELISLAEKADLLLDHQGLGQSHHCLSDTEAALSRAGTLIDKNNWHLAVLEHRIPKEQASPYNFARPILIGQNRYTKSWDLGGTILTVELDLDEDVYGWDADYRGIETPTVATITMSRRYPDQDLDLSISTMQNSSQCVNIQDLDRALLDLYQSALKWRTISQEA